MHDTLLPLAVLVPGPNTRTDFPEKALEELAASIRAQGLLQPILVRPLSAPHHSTTPPPPSPPPSYQIICGERRYRAALRAGLTAVPCTIRPCTDTEAAELQLIENLQREDVHRLDESARMRQLIDSGQHTAETLAARLGKSKQWVWACLKLGRLPGALQARCRTGELNDSLALLLARIPDEQQMLKAAAAIAPEGKAPLSCAAATQVINTRFMRRLKGAPFVLKTDPSCLTCPHRTGSQPHLYPDASADVCTHPPCYARKARAAGASPPLLAVEGRGERERPSPARSVHTASASAPSPKLLDRAKTLAAECVADASRPMRATGWLRWLAEHSTGAPTEADWQFLGVQPGRPRQEYLAAQTVNSLTALLVRAALHPDRLLATPPLHSDTPAPASPWHPRFLQALTLANLHAP